MKDINGKEIKAGQTLRDPEGRIYKTRESKRGPNFLDILALQFPEIGKRTYEIEDMEIVEE